ncbi:MAG TPA: hypothetical protein VHD56_16220 [Tepidisphaeraceae bacterium]|nr:hypothetical protein [Tepidisphaeraceae bacterium]
MNWRGSLIIGGISLLPLVCGCSNYTDLTQTPDVQRLDVLGKWYRVVEDSDLIKDHPSDTLEIVRTDYPHYPRNHHVGKVGAGTVVVTCRVVRIGEWTFPFYYEYNTIMGVIMDGPHAGKEVNMLETFETQPSNLYEPTTKPANDQSDEWAFRRLRKKSN